MTRYIIDEKGNKRFVKGHKHRFRAVPENLKGVPERLVATDIQDPDKISELDAPHIVDDLIATDIEKSVQGSKSEPKKLKCAQPGEVVPLSQWEIDVVRMRVLSSLVNSLLNRAASGETVDLGVRHLWFPKNNVNNYELRNGNPPSDKRRPKHMRGFRVEVDLCHIPEGIQRVIEEQKQIESLGASNG